MKNYRKHIDEFFRERLGRYAETPPDDVWSSLDKRLDTLPPAGAASPNRWLAHFGMVAVVLVAAFSFMNKKSFQSQPDVANPSAEHQPVAALAATAHQPSPVATQENKAEVMAAMPSAAQVTNAGQAANIGNARSIAGNNPNTLSGIGQVSGRLSKVASGNSVQGVAAKKIGIAAATTTNTGQGAATVAHSFANRKPAVPGEVLNTASFKVGAGDAHLLAEAINAATQKKENEKKEDAQVAKAVKDIVLTKNIGFTRVEAAVLAGYERGADNSAARKWVIAGRLQYNLSARFAVMVQPGMKYGQVNTRSVGNAQSYHKVNNDATVSQVGNIDTRLIFVGSDVDTEYTAKYAYTQTHDSIVKTSVYGGKFFEFELPISLKYNLSKKVSVYGGINVLYSTLGGIQERTYTKAGILKTGSSTVVTTDRLVAPPVESVLTYSDNPIGSYTGAQFSASPVNQLRIGYVVGLSYQCTQRWLLDCQLQQSPMAATMRGNINLNAPFSGTNFRLGIGYKFIK